MTQEILGSEYHPGHASAYFWPVCSSIHPSMYLFLCPIHQLIRLSILPIVHLCYLFIYLSIHPSILNSSPHKRLNPAIHLLSTFPWRWPFREHPKVTSTNDAPMCRPFLNSSLWRTFNQIIIITVIIIVIVIFITIFEMVYFWSFCSLVFV